MKSFIIFLLLSSLSNIAFSQTFQSSTSKTQLLELYSSQGCSSCPPAERWFSSLTEHPELWTKFVPLVFHVDYWNYLGWKDPFSNSIFSQRQRRYYSQKAISSVYTPGVLLDGHEWRGWYRTKRINDITEVSGHLIAKLNNNMLSVSYSDNKKLILNIALLGSGIKTDVLSGENRNHSFKEDFIVLSMRSKTSNNGKWTLPFNINSKFNVERHAIAIWVSSLDNMKPLQATGGWIINH